MNLDQFIIQRRQFLTQGAKFLNFCPHFYAAYKNEKLIVGPFIMRSPKFEEAILACKSYIEKIWSNVTPPGETFDKECFRKLSKHLIQMYSGHKFVFWYFVKRKV